MFKIPLIQNGGISLAVIQNNSRRQDVSSYKAEYSEVNRSSAIFVYILRHLFTSRDLRYIYLHIKSLS